MFRQLDEECRECGGSLIQDLKNGEILCSECGLVIRLKLAFSRLEFTKNCAPQLAS
jgi:transcription initiation factor TFIIIB Brf1 subunit/transcription initiation factor TFIIB